MGLIDKPNRILRSFNQWWLWDYDGLWDKANIDNQFPWLAEVDWMKYSKNENYNASYNEKLGCLAIRSFFYGQDIRMKPDFTAPFIPDNFEVPRKWRL